MKYSTKEQSEDPIHQGFVSLNNYRYAKVSLLIWLIVLVLYFSHDPGVTPNGGTWLGYTLGTIGFALILWLSFFGIRKRRYGGGAVHLKVWLSAHIWLGLSLSLIGTLHTGMHFGWNVHTLAYALMMIVIISGIWGVFMYIRNPSLMSELLGGKTLVQIGALMTEFDDSFIAVAKNLDIAEKNQIQQAFTNMQKEAISGNVWQKLSPFKRASATKKLLTYLEGVALQSGGTPELRELVKLTTKRDYTLTRIRKFVKLKTMTDIWLFFHIPLTVALIAALIVHVVSVFIYW